MTEEQPRKLGQGHAAAMLRQGAKELAQILPAFPSGPVQPVEEPGLVGNLTPQEVVQGKGVEQGYQAALRGYAAGHTRGEAERPPAER